MFNKIKSTYHDFPQKFWVLILATFVDSLGNGLLFPFYALYVTEHFNVGMIEVGLLFSFLSAGGIIGSILGGSLSDKYGRKRVLLFGLIFSGLGNLVMGFAEQLTFFYLFATLLGLLGAAGRPARQAMVADMLPLEKRNSGYAILRVTSNLSITIGPALGGLLLTQGFLTLFIGDALASAVTAVIVFMKIPETKPKRKSLAIKTNEANGLIETNEAKESFLETMKGYFHVFSDGLFMLFVIIASLVALVYMQMNSTLAVFLRDQHGFPANKFGLLMSLNAGMVVIFQFFITRKISRFSPFKMMALGVIFYGTGFLMYGFVSNEIWFFVAMAIITIGEMIIASFSQALVALFAPEDKRGRYMAVFSLKRTIPRLFGVLLAGMIMNKFGDYVLWYVAGILCLISAVGYIILSELSKKRLNDLKISLDNAIMLENEV
ncbi:MAG: MDR family MFS transporter [Promethearchaeota archaeon]